MSKLPSISSEWELLPALPESLESALGITALAPIIALPKKLPHTAYTHKLKEMYQFGDDDWTLVWGATAYAMKSASIAKCDGESVPDSGDPEDADICTIDGDDSGGSGESDNLVITHNYWLPAVMNAQKDRLGVWIRDTYIGNRSSGSLNRGEPVHGPATPVRKPMPPMPTPTFSPRASSGGGVKLGESVKPVLQIDKKTKKLEANPPTDECLDKDTKHVLVYDPEAGAMAWECQGGGDSGCCGLLELTYVPPEGYGNGIARKIIGYTETGKFIYDDEEIPVKIPRI